MENSLVKSSAHSHLNETKNKTRQKSICDRHDSASKLHIKYPTQPKRTEPKLGTMCMILLRSRSLLIYNQFYLICESICND